MSHYEVLKAIKFGISSDHYTTLLAKIYGQSESTYIQLYDSEGYALVDSDGFDICVKE